LEKTLMPLKGGPKGTQVGPQVLGEPYLSRWNWECQLLPSRKLPKKYKNGLSRANTKARKWREVNERPNLKVRICQFCKVLFGLQWLWQGKGKYERKTQEKLEVNYNALAKCWAVYCL